MHNLALAFSCCFFFLSSHFSRLLFCCVAFLLSFIRPTNQHMYVITFNYMRAPFSGLRGMSMCCTYLVCSHRYAACVCSVVFVRHRISRPGKASHTCTFVMNRTMPRAFRPSSLASLMIRAILQSSKHCINSARVGVIGFVGGVIGFVGSRPLTTCV